MKKMLFISLFVCFLSCVTTLVFPQEKTKLKLSLKEAVEKSLAQSFQSQTAELRVKEAQSISNQVRSQLFPQAALNLSESNQINNLSTFGLKLPGFPSLVGPFDVYEARLDVSVQLINFSNIARFYASLKNTQASKTSLLKTENELSAAAAKLYYLLKMNEAQIREAAATLKLFQAIEKLNQSQLKVGVNTPLELNRAQYQVSLQNQRKLQFEENYQQNKLGFLTLLNEDFNQEIELSDNFNLTLLLSPQEEKLDLPTAIAMAFEKRPELLEMQEKIKAKEQLLAAEKVSRFPSLSANFHGGYNGDQVEQLDWNRQATLNLNLPIFSGGLIQTKITQASTQLQQQLLEKKQLEKQIEQEVRQAVLHNSNTKQQLELAEKNKILSKKELQMASDRYSAGLGTNLELSLAQTNFVSAQENYLARQAELILSQIEFHRALGDVKDWIIGEKNE
ncbi:MAG: TolC family protein [Deltaproteobacteria bacterium]|nr:TolC family protein [Deltaproteobacteria bacterium]